MASYARYQPCDLLAQAATPNVVWFEDLLTRYRSNTMVFEVQLFVADPEHAATVLSRSGYKKPPLKIAFEGDAVSTRGGLRMAIPGQDPKTGVLLHSASNWNYDLTSPVHNYTPPIEKFVDSMAGYWLRMSDEDFESKSLLAGYV
ncbi:MAG: ser/thr protein phosphatase, partial [Massilia sp.]|nr:ser/thr protein phosphatase [Massilia sp.]